MYRGDISNTTAPSIAIRVEDTLVREIPASKLKTFVFGHKLELISYTYRVALKVFTKTPFNLYLVCGNEFFTKYEGQLTKLLHRLPIETIVLVDAPHEVAIHLNEGNFNYYVDLDLSRASRVNHRGCITLEALKQYTKI